MSRPWMPLYIADYLADTGHLSAAEHGAYLLLIMHYWQAGSLPDDDRRLARIVRMSEQEWTATRPVVREFFGAGWRHERIDGELAEADRLSKAGRKGGEASGEARRKRNPRPSKPHADDEPTFDERSAKQNANDLPTICEAPQPPPHPQKDDGMEARAREPLISPEATALAREFLSEIGYPDPLAIPPEWCGVAYRAQVWLASKWTEPIILATTRKIMSGRPAPPGLKYFETAFANAFASLAADVPAGSPTEKTNANTGNVIAAADRLVDRVRQLGRPAPTDAGPVRIGARAPALRAIPQR